MFYNSQKMKIQHIVLLAIIMGSMNFCKHKKEVVRETSDSIVAEEQFRNTAVAVDPAEALIVDNNASNQDGQNWKKEEIASGTAFYKLRYCGGARPTPDIEKEFNQEHLLVSQKIKFVNVDDKSDFVIVSTDENGCFTVVLHQGSYDYFLVYTEGSKWPPNPGCQKYYERIYGKITVGDGSWSGYKLLYSFPCDPCSPPKP